MHDQPDDLDRRLLALLREDGRASTAALAERLKVSRGTVQNRIDRLQRSGLLVGFTIKLRNELESSGVRAITLIELRGGASDAVIAALRQIPEVVQVHTTNGRWDLVAEIHTGTLVEFDRVLRELRAIKGVANSESNLLLAAYK
ncbi:Lrp/AsnC family transcriptional regulator [Pseudomonas sp. OF001]|mgnify:FL=1|jgi:DNA-binding Lrp family transcriptional regulator|uniref:Lrp/AsnC family transcriptional regulator n=1 Tax=unclassified Pseudomonas TaxID=196821 RepID=UPI0010A638FF|nr:MULTISPECIES: Lrp/AsnC family transcriptional regulator [unclassified Pseudomonas]THG81539.1 Lrp/AsnC family transcriptional regulator [Pseudomonas sp. A-1]WPP44034.1 Lrp/AsnC family transcriptional regulator [Pseudomonas sp. AN-1]CAD5379733.1 Lrp/AsnC family transcriptional regulator [Pseudomonas sp. OF001]